MACNSDNMSATTLETDLSRVACLLDEVAGVAVKPHHWQGYHPRVYGKADRALADQMVRELCDALQGRDVSKHSLEMQLWWRDHQAADKVRLENEQAEADAQAERDAAAAALTARQRQVLGLG